MKNSTFFMVFCLAAFSSAIMLYVTGLELTTLTNLLFIIIPQGYLPCVKLFTSSIGCPPFDFCCNCQVATSLYQKEFLFHPSSLKLFFTRGLSAGFDIQKSRAGFPPGSGHCADLAFLPKTTFANNL